MYKIKIVSPIFIVSVLIAGLGVIASFLSFFLGEFSRSFLTIMLLYVSVIFIIYIVFSYQKGNNRGDIKKYTFEFCISDTRNYESLFNLKNNLKNTTESKLLQSQQAEALQFFNKIAIGIKSDILEDKIIYDYYYRYFSMAQKSLKYIFLEYRQKNEDPYIYIDYLKLLDEWNHYGERKYV
ncbi:hypothetical protein FACS1894172_17340 [Spirochaetia bacterium]|nr:hypothetical protein FACS1894172_17340 [Spirochaetia bacterium]